jgi:dihydrofolate reductase
VSDRRPADRGDDEAVVIGPPQPKEKQMSKVIALMSMSLDGFVADPDDGVAEVFDWYVASGDVEITTGGSAPMTFRMSGPSAEHVHVLTSGLGALITGRRTFEVADGWGGNHAWGPAFVLTHDVPAGWPRPDSTVHFVSDGIESAVAQAKAAAGDRSVAVHGADTIQQLWNAGLLDEISVDIAAVLLGSGVRLFDQLAGTPAQLGNPTVTAGFGVTHLRYPVIQPSGS